MYYESFLQMKKMLGQVEKWLDLADAYAKEKSFDANLFLSFRLAPDQFAFARLEVRQSGGRFGGRSRSYGFVVRAGALGRLLDHGHIEDQAAAFDGRRDHHARGRARAIE